MTMGNIVVDHSDLEDDIICPHCNAKGEGLVVEDYTTVHSREVLVECGECNKLYKIYYKFDKTIKLVEEE